MSMQMEILKGVSMNRRQVADARWALLFMDYACVAFGAAREAFEREDYEEAVFFQGLAMWCLEKSNHYLRRYFGEKKVSVE